MRAVVNSEHPYLGIFAFDFVMRWVDLYGVLGRSSGGGKQATCRAQQHISQFHTAPFMVGRKTTLKDSGCQTIRIGRKPAKRKMFRLQTRKVSAFFAQHDNS